MARPVRVESRPLRTLRWIAQDEWCGQDLTMLSSDWVGERCRLRKDHLGQHSPVFGADTYGGELFSVQRVEPGEYFFRDAERVEQLLLSIEHELVWTTMWSKGYVPVTPIHWEMWHETNRYGAQHDDWLRGDFVEVHLKAQVVGNPVRR